MLTRPTLSTTFTEFYSGDPAFLQPDPAPPKDAPAEVHEAYAKHVKAYDEKRQRARDTGNWKELAIDGQQPTAFKVRLLKDSEIRALHSMLEYREIGDSELTLLAFRCTTVGIENGGPIAHRASMHPKLGPILHAEVADELAAIAPGLVDELGLLALKRGSQGLSPHR